MPKADARKPLYDIHSHVLPDLDDGAVDEDMALAMLRASAERGVTHIVVTPHSDTVFAKGREVFEERLTAVRALISEHSLPIEVLPGMEVHLVLEAPDRLAAGEYWPLGASKYVLAELDYVQWANYTEDVLFGIAVQGYTPLLAHVERIVPLQERPELVEKFVSNGFYTQITAMSLLGGMGPTARKSAEHFLRKGLVHTVASDMHRPSGSRQPMPAGTLDRLCELVGEEASDTLFHGNPAAVLAGGRLRHAEPAPIKRKRWWRLGLG